MKIYDTTFADGEFREAAAYMLAHNVKLEQGISGQEHIRRMAETSLKNWGMA